MVPDLVIDIPGLPLPQGSKKIGTYKKDGEIRRSIIDNNPRLAQWRLQVTSYVRQAVASRGDFNVPDDAAVEVRITFYLPRPQSHFGTGRNAGVLKDSAPSYPVKPPDVDKLIRSILDGVTDAGLWHDDAQVVDCYAHKRWAPRGPGARACIAVL